MPNDKRKEFGYNDTSQSCADSCKAKMRYCTTKYFEARQDHFVCANYRSNTGSCSAHFIRAVVLEQMVWEHMKEVIWYVGHYERHFREIMERLFQNPISFDAKRT